MANFEKASTAALAREMVDSVQDKISALEEGNGINFPPELQRSQRTAHGMASNSGSQRSE